jgi:hypothetical protein
MPVKGNKWNYFVEYDPEARNKADRLKACFLFKLET